MTSTDDVVRRSWPLGDGVRLRERVIAAYEQPWRHYHDVRHLAEVLGRVDEICSRTAHLDVDEEVVRLAAYFHDVVYRPTVLAPTNEERSAAVADRWLSSAGLRPAVVAEVVRLVRGTADHVAAAGDRHAALLYDADLAILAAGPQRYAEYVRDVRTEYAAVPDEDFAAGRARILSALLRQDGLFATAYGQEQWERAARANVEQELSGLL